MSDTPETQPDPAKDLAAADGLPAPSPEAKRYMAQRFRGFLPVVVDVETAGFEAGTDALLEIAAVLLEVDDDLRWRRGRTVAAHVKPFEGANLDPAALKFNGIDPWHPFRLAVTEQDALGKVFTAVRAEVARTGCTRAVLVGHNAWFDLGFLKAAVARCGIKRNPFHAFSSFDTASLAGMFYGQTVLARAVRAAGLPWDEESAHSAIYDAEQTAELFCAMVNRYTALGADPYEPA